MKNGMLKRVKDYLCSLKNGAKYNYNYYKIKKYIKGREYQTSVSDNNIYPALCQAASENHILFNKFRRNYIYNKVLEHITKEQGQEYLTIILGNKEIKFSKEDWENFKRNDLYGAPRLAAYEINGHFVKISPTTLRYVKVLQDIITLFDVKKLNSIAEIGIGYGGECRILLNYFDRIKKYYLFDLPEVLQLSRCWLGKTFSEREDINRVEFVDGLTISIDKKYDLVISNYAFSELTREIQDVYLEKVILKSKSGYITWNSLSYNNMDGYALGELIEKIPNSFIVPEEPLTAPDNCIIVFGGSK